jgi:hypothetical protein
MKVPGSRMLLATIFALTFGLAAARETELRDEAAAKMAKAANEFLEGLDEAQRSRASFAFDSPVRLDWHFVPRERKGLAIGDLDAEDRARFDALLDSALSKEGHAKFDGVLKLEAILRAREGDWRDPAKYHVAVFGKPGNDPWSWRVEGHHYSAHFTSVDAEVIAVTPNFVGANPATALWCEDTRLKSIQVLLAEEGLAHRFVTGLQEDELIRAHIDGELPQDVLLDPSKARLEGQPAGIRATDLAPGARKALLAIVENYFADLSTDLAERERARFTKHALDDLHFAWAGEKAGNEPWYWRVQGSYFAIEFVYPRGDENHAHRIWRDFERDFGGDPLRAHLAKEK